MICRTVKKYTYPKGLFQKIRLFLPVMQVCSHSDMLKRLMCLSHCRYLYILCIFYLDTCILAFNILTPQGSRMVSEAF